MHKTRLMLGLCSSAMLMAVPSPAEHQHVTAAGQKVAASSVLITVLQEIASQLSSGSQANALSQILREFNAGVTVFDIQTLEQARQQALPILTSSGGLSTIKIIEYTGIIVEAIAQLEAARVSAAASSTAVTTTVH